MCSTVLLLFVGKKKVHSPRYSLFIRGLGPKCAQIGRSQTLSNTISRCILYPYTRGG